MAEVPLVEHFPLVSATASLIDISTGRVFDGGNSVVERAAGTLGLGHRVGDTYHWSSSMEGKPSWAITDGSTKVLHVRAHDCPNPGTPLHPDCYDCLTDRMDDDVEFVFTWKTTRAESFPDPATANAPHSVPPSVDHVVAPADAPLNELFETPWTDVFGTAQYDLGTADLLLQHCGACPNPMDPRSRECSTCVQSRAPADFPNADYVMFVKMFRPADGLERRTAFPDLREARGGRSAPARFGNSETRDGDRPDDTGHTRVFTG